MKIKILFVFFILLGLISCSERHFDASERYVVQGIILKNGQPLPHERVGIDTYLSDEWQSGMDTLAMEWYDSYTIINAVYTDKNGAFKMSFPRGNYVYILYLDKYQQVLFDGKNTGARQFFDLGRIDIANKK
ncbi:hypothetical protein HX004_12715 [Myroides sp. 1354]|uniref:hypothetical protein n=1 Tax=unclassified Myroides TaxID=2642485 RepID=UPI002577ACDD|nr:MULTISPECIES: hypothetical protein [unclassified Myroides]MDM1045632.1 hypothetical protein [Myroides sp. R163-1]MDM1056634.1 hypothetical protein [Myroides sp. 1354]MDM1069762.1 hypothetical protein [Myroides sp. 1372]